VTTRLRSTLLLVVLSVLWIALAIGGPVLLVIHANAGTTDGGKSLLQGYVTILHLHDVPKSLAAPWFAEVLLIAALGTPTIILFTLLLDPQGYSTRALRWSLRTLPCLLAWLCATLICAWLMIALGSDQYLGLLIPLTWIASPFLYLRTDAISRDRPPPFWLPDWPGTPAVAIGVVAIAAVYGTDLLVWEISQLAIPKVLSWALVILLGLSSLVFEMVVTAYVLLAWKHRWQWSQLAPGFRCATLAPYARVIAAVDLQLGWIAALLLIPLLLGAPGVFNFIGSHIDQGLQSPAPNAPFYAAALTGLSRFFVSYGWFMVMVAYGTLRYWIPFTSEARSLHFAEATEDSGHA
jgi:hypothetical protein